jgi:hypothetical protein
MQQKTVIFIQVSTMENIQEELLKMPFTNIMKNTMIKWLKIM